MNLLFLGNKRRSLFPIVSPDLVSAYSLRRVYGYNSNLIRVRRSSDNSEQNIGFAGNDLDTSGLLSFILAEGNKYISDYADLTGWTNTNSVITSESGVNGYDDVMSVEDNATVSHHSARRNGTFNTLKNYEIRFEYYIPNTNSALEGVRCWNGVFNDGASDHFVKGEWVEAVFNSFNPVSGDPLWFTAIDSEGTSAYSGTGEKFYIKNVRVTEKNCDGFVATIYDQGKLGRNLYESTAAYQPMIVSNGTVITRNNMPAIHFHTTQARLQRQSGIFKIESVIMMQFGVNGSGADYVLEFGEPRFSISVTGGGFYDTSGYGSLVNYEGTNLVWLEFDQTTCKFYKGGSTISQYTKIIATNTQSALYVGNDLTRGDSSGYISEVLLYSKSKFKDYLNIRENINDYWVNT